jgi:uncharacterized protein YpuA (DUF1002 family)
MKILKKAQEFSEKKLRWSLKKAGAVPKAMASAVGSVKTKLKKGAIKTTSDIRRVAGSVLKKLDPRAWKKYMKFKKR